MLSEHKLRYIEETLTSAMCDGPDKMSQTELTDFAVRELRRMVIEYRRLTNVTCPLASTAA